MEVALFFGSFNPVHVGHMIIASYLVEYTTVDQLWMVVSPHNPHKEKKSLAKDHDRLHLVRLAIGDHPKLRASNIEFDLPQPSYTIDTLTYLGEKYPNYNFHLVMGGDNIKSFHKWKNYEQILERHHIYVYQRPEYKLGTLADHEHVHILEAPMLQISASMIRKMIGEGKSVKYYVPDKVNEYIESSHLYKRK